VFYNWNSPTEEGQHKPFPSQHLSSHPPAQQNGTHQGVQTALPGEPSPR
jgi:hypothetical protein